jgi:hypothetical protein
MPCSCGSIISEYLSELVRIAPFSVDTLSGGKPCVFQPATIASSQRTVNGFEFSLIGTLLSLKNSKNLARILSLKILLNGPIYETKADARRTSPIITYKRSLISIID